MRSSIEPDKENDGNESVFFNCQQNIHIDGPVKNNPTLEELEKLDRDLFGSQPQEESVDGNLQWSNITADNHVIRMLKKASNNMTLIFDQQVKNLEKDIRKAKKVFYG